MSESTDAREWRRIIRASVRECLETWTLQAQAGPRSYHVLSTRPPVRSVNRGAPSSSAAGPGWATFCRRPLGR